jgi:type IV fimbrial biogenesis protein FimT
MSVTHRLTLGHELSNGSGFTMIELMLTIAIVAIVMSIAIPNFTTTIKNNRLTTQANDFVTALNIARSEAVKRGYQVTLCKSTNGTACVTTGNWAQGWIIFADQDNDRVFDVGETTLRVQGGTQGQISMLGSAQITSIISYASGGQIAPSNAQHTITICDDRAGNFGKTITINPLGRPSTSVNSTCP